MNKFDQKAIQTTDNKRKAVPSAERIIATAFWNYKGVVFNGYLKDNKTNTRAHYASFLDDL